MYSGSLPMRDITTSCEIESKLLNVCHKYHADVCHEGAHFPKKQSLAQLDSRLPFSTVQGGIDKECNDPPSAVINHLEQRFDTQLAVVTHTCSSPV